jgi:hypothetical protein
MDFNELHDDIIQNRTQKLIKESMRNDDTLKPILRALATYGYTIVPKRDRLVPMKMKVKNPRKPDYMELENLFKMMYNRAQNLPDALSFTNMTRDNDHIMEFGKVIDTLVETKKTVPREYMKQFIKWSSGIYKPAMQKGFPYNKYRDIVVNMRNLNKR